jgi:hypothetical protein
MSVLLCILYQTGTAEKFSKRRPMKLSNLWQECTRFPSDGYRHYKHRPARQRLTFFLLATWRWWRKPTDNAMAFYEWLTKTSGTL